MTIFRRFRPIEKVVMWRCRYCKRLYEKKVRKCAFVDEHMFHLGEGRGG